MKNLYLILIFLLIPQVLALSTDMKPIYQPGETMILEISGNVLEPIEKEDVELRRKHVQVPFEYDIKRIGKNFYLYAILPQIDNNYTLIIKGITTTQNGVIKKMDFQQNFSVSGETIPYTIKPGFVITKEDFEITIFLNKDIEELIKIDYPEVREIIISPGENKIPFSIKLFEPGFKIINIGIYSIPLLILEEGKSKEKINLPEFRFVPKIIKGVILLDEESEYPFTLVNNGVQPLTNIILDFNPEVFIVSPTSVEILHPGEEKEFSLAVISKNQPIYDKIIARSGDYKIELDINITFTENLEEVKIPYLEEDYSETQGYFCSELKGRFCSIGETCSNQTVPSFNGEDCCLGECIAPPPRSLAWLGYLIAIIIIIVLIIIGGRYYKTRM